MWPFRKKQTLKESGFFRGFTDWHCHILPDVDDGVQTMDEALQILGEYERLGVKAHSAHYGGYAKYDPTFEGTFR